MQQKKSDKADLGNKRILFFEIGLIISLLAVILVFRHSTNLRGGACPPRPATMHESGYDDWNDVSALEVSAGSRSAPHPAKSPLSDKIEIVKDDIRLKAQEDARKNADEEGEKTEDGNYSRVGYHSSNTLDTPKEKKAGTAVDDYNTIEYFFITFVRTPNPGHLLEGAIIMPYTVGTKMDTARLERYASSMESFIRNRLHVAYRPYITELPLDHFAVGAQNKPPSRPRFADANAGDHLPSIPDLLKKHAWKANISGSEYCTIMLKFNNQKEVKTTIIGKKRYRGRTAREYYLSNTADALFDKDRVGSKSSGRYIVTETFSGIPEINEILEINDSVLITRLLPDRLPITYHVLGRR